jgi:hypothetical protein
MAITAKRKADEIEEQDSSPIFAVIAVKKKARHEEDTTSG